MDMVTDASMDFGGNPPVNLEEALSIVKKAIDLEVLNVRERVGAQLYQIATRRNSGVMDMLPIVANNPKQLVRIAIKRLQDTRIDWVPTGNLDNFSDEDLIQLLREHAPKFVIKSIYQNTQLSQGDQTIDNEVLEEAIEFVNVAGALGCNIPQLLGYSLYNATFSFPDSFSDCNILYHGSLYFFSETECWDFLARQILEEYPRLGTVENIPAIAEDFDELRDEEQLTLGLNKYSAKQIVDGYFSAYKEPIKEASYMARSLARRLGSRQWPIPGLLCMDAIRLIAPSNLPEVKSFGFYSIMEAVLSVN